MVRRLFALSLMAVGLPWFVASCGDSGSSVAKIQRDRVAYIGTVPFEPPLLYQKEGEVVGPDAEIGNRIVAEIQKRRQTESSSDIRVLWINRTYPTLQTALQNGEVDFVLGVYAVTEERKKQLDFSEPYYQSELVVIINPVHKKLTVNELSGVTVGVREGSGVEEVLKARFSGVKTQPFRTLDDAVLALRRSEVDAVVDDRLMAAYVLATAPGVAHMEILPESIGSISCAVAARKGDKQLIEIANDIIAEIKKGDLYRQWVEAHRGFELLQQVEIRHKERLAEEEKAKRARQILISVARAQNFDFDIYRMANLRFTFRNQQSGASFQSSPITFEGRTGKATASIPPGTYQFILERFNFSAPLDIIPADPDRVPITITISAAGVDVRKG